MQKVRRKKARSALYAFLLLFTLFSLFFVIAEAGHDCTHENCPICLIIQSFQQNMQLLRLILCTAAASLAFFSKTAKHTFGLLCIHIEQFSLFLQKTRLND